jgi:predicted Rossmann fold flavoprotein
MSPTIGIIGAGAAGMMCAATLLETDPQAQVILFEKNPGLGRKVLISGGGRCNVTTGIQDLSEVLKAYPRGQRFLRTAFYNFPPQAVMAWFERNGVPLKTEADRRVFPQSDNGHDVVGVFQKKLHENQLKTNTTVKAVRKEGSQFTITTEDESVFTVDHLVLATGGQAYRHTGSTGDGYSFAESLGHSITDLLPSLNSFITQESWPKDLAGVSFQDVILKTKQPEKHEHRGPMLFTHKGISGPAVFALSSLVAPIPYGKEEPLRITLDLLPDQTHTNLENHFQTARTEQSAKVLKNILSQLIPKSLASTLCQILKMDEQKPISELTKKDQHRLIEWLKNLPLHAIGRGAGDEFVTAGGIPLKEVNPKTMESKICPNLYLTGELLNVDGFTGGFNLQAAWATGRLAAESIAKSL